MTTLAPTTLAPTPFPTTLAPTTLVPTTSIPDVDIYVDPIYIYVKPIYCVLHYNPPMPRNEGLDQEAQFNPLVITLSSHGYLQEVGYQPNANVIRITTAFKGINVGKVISSDPISLKVSIVTKSPTISIQISKCNFVKWSKIGSLDFTIDESNIAGERPLDWKGCVWHLMKLGDKVIAYGENGVSILKPSGVHWGMDTIYRIGLKNKGAFAGSDEMHFFVDNLGQLFKIDQKITKLDYSEFIYPMGNVVLSLDLEKRILYICDGSVGYVYGIDTGSFGIGPANVTGISSQGGNIYAVSNGEILTPKFEICTDIYDFGTRNYKTIREIEFGTDLTENLYASVDYRNSYRDEFRQIPWFLVNPDGRAHPKCYGMEFRFRLISTVYEYFELDYVKIKGHIHGWLGFTYAVTDQAYGVTKKTPGE